MAKSKRRRQAKNKIEGAHPGSLIKFDADPYVEAPRTEQRDRATITRSTIFTAELEAVIEIIATERVYRAMLAGVRRRIVKPPPKLLTDSSNPEE